MKKDAKFWLPNNDETRYLASVLVGFNPDLRFRFIDNQEKILLYSERDIKIPYSVLPNPGPDLRRLAGYPIFYERRDGYAVITPRDFRIRKTYPLKAETVDAINELSKRFKKKKCEVIDHAIGELLKSFEKKV